MAHLPPALQRFAIAARAAEAGAPPAEEAGRRELLARLDALAVDASRRPLRVLGTLLTVNAALLPVFIAAGLLVATRRCSSARARPARS